MTHIHVDVFRSIEAVPPEAWDALAPTGRVALERAHLAALAESGINAHRPYYFVGRAGGPEGAPVGIAHAFALDMDLSALGDDVAPETRRTLKAWYPDFMVYRLLEVGLITSLGEGIVAAPEHFDAFLDALVPALDEVAAEESAEVMLVRDVRHDRYPAFKGLERHGFSPALGFPAAVLDLRWPDFDGWLADLKSARRYNARKKMKRFARPGMSVEILKDFSEHAERLADLWAQVERRQSDYSHEQVTPDWFRALDRHLGDRSEVIALKRGDTIVAMALCLLGEEEYFWAYVGLDDDHRLEYDLYFNLMFEGIRRAIETGRPKLNLGITTYDFKLFVGAELVPQVFFLRHLKDPDLSPALADMFGESIKQPANDRHSFSTPPPERVDAAALKRRFHPAGARSDAFYKLSRYTRTKVMKAVDLYAFFPAFETAQDPVVRHAGRDVVMLGTNSYLGLATHPEVKAAAKEAIDRYGTGCSGSPFLNGTLDLHEKLERELAEFMGKEEALLFSTGYQTNLGAVSTLAGRHDVIVMDERNHASLIDGARLSRSTVLRFPHNDMAALEAILAETAGRPTMIVVDSLFSMEGTTINLPEVVRLKRKYGARLFLDESHALGVCGAGGRGVGEQFGLLDDVDVVMGTFSKSFASIGGFIACSHDIYEGLKHTARSHMFSASLPPSAVAVVRKALEIVKTEPERRQRLLDNARTLARGLIDIGWPARDTGSAIVPVDVGDELLTLAVFHKLFEEGVFVNPVLYPAVPKGGELLRLSVMPTAEKATLDRAIRVFEGIRTPDFPKAEVLRAAG